MLNLTNVFINSFKITHYWTGEVSENYLYLMLMIFRFGECVKQRKHNDVSLCGFNNLYLPYLMWISFQTVDRIHDLGTFFFIQDGIINVLF